MSKKSATWSRHGRRPYMGINAMLNRLARESFERHLRMAEPMFDSVAEAMLWVRTLRQR